MMKKISILAAVVAFLAMTSVSFAANTADVSVTSEPIAKATSCGKAGGFTLSFDVNTVFTVGDQIRFDLDENVTLCKNIDLVIGGYSAAGATVIPTTAGVFQTATSSSAITVSDATNSKLTIVPGASNTGMYFRLVGSAGSQRVSLYVLGDVNSTDGTAATFTGNDSADVLKISFLNGTDYSNGTSATEAYVYDVTKIDANKVGLDALTTALADTADNSMCINISDANFTASKVFANFDAVDDKYLFVPSNPQVAHIVGATTYTLEDSYKSRQTGNLVLPGTAVQGSTSTCNLIDNSANTSSDSTSGSYAPDYGFCATGDLHQYNNIVISNEDGFTLEGNIQVTYEILVNGESGANGVYWSGASFNSGHGATLKKAVTNASLNTFSGKAYKSNGTSEVLTFDTGVDCDVDDDSKATIVKATATASSMELTTGKYPYMTLDMPDMVIDSSEVSKGDVLSVKVTVESLPCGAIIDGETWEIGTFGCTATGTSYSQRYPYFGKTTGKYANVIIITNVSDNDGTATLTLYEEDGDIFTTTVSVGAHKLAVNLLGNLDWTATDKTGGGTVGDVRSYVECSADFSVDGTAMITNQTTGESIGYLPRQSN
jgi:hypothetical protein